MSHDIVLWVLAAIMALIVLVVWSALMTASEADERAEEIHRRMAAARRWEVAYYAARQDLGRDPSVAEHVSMHATLFPEVWDTPGAPEEEVESYELIGPH
jgi:hypothetical protein